MSSGARGERITDYAGEFSQEGVTQAAGENCSTPAPASGAPTSAGPSAESRSPDSIEQLVAGLREAAANIRRTQAPEQADGCLERCVELASRIAEQVDDLQRRLDTAENVLHEQTLQTLAHRAAARTDGLTGVANRRAFDDELSERCEDAFRSAAPLTLLLIDIDHFKPINDSLGHTAGDAILRGVALVLRESMPAGSSVARYGGEEFAVILPGVFLEHAVRLADELRENVQRTIFRFESHSTRVTISCGVAQLLSREHWSVLIQRADSALYASKQAGRNRTHWHDGAELRQAGASSEDPRTVSERVLELDSANAGPPSAGLELRGQLPRARGIPGVARGNWCDSSMLFWYLRQRIAEWRRGGEAFTVVAIDVDDRTEIRNRYGSRALHFVHRAQLLHLDSCLRDMDIVGRLVESRVAVVLPRTGLTDALPLLARLIRGASRFAYPAGGELLEYSISIGVACVDERDDASRLVKRAEQALNEAQRGARAALFLHDGDTVRPLDLSRA